MEPSPFIYGNTVSDHAFTNRENEIKKLKTNLLSGINTMIISPRRWGKSSLVERVTTEIKKEHKNHKLVMIDLFTCSSEEVFLETYAREVIRASSNKWQEWVNSSKDLFKNLMPKISLGIDPLTDFSISFDWKDLVKYSEEILNLSETLAIKRGIKLIICLDEFQNIATFPNFEVFEKKLRGVWQRHKSTTYCLYGSKQHMMTEIFNNPSKPFYRFGDIMILPRIQTEKWHEFIVSSFIKSKKQIDPETAIWIPKLMKNHSWYVQQLAHYTWNITDLKATHTELAAALTELIYANTPLYQKEVESISTTQLNLLKAVVKGETMFTATATMHKYHLGTPRNVSKNKAILIQNDLIHEVDGKYEFLDPAFELWFGKQYFNQSYYSFLK